MAPSRSRSTSQTIEIYEDQYAHDHDNATTFDDDDSVHDISVDDDDPFSASDLSREEDYVARSIEEPDNFSGDSTALVQGSHAHHRSFSRTIHQDFNPHYSDDDDPFGEAENDDTEIHHDTFGDNNYQRLDASGKLRGAAEARKGLPEEMQYYKSPLPGRSMLHQRSPLSSNMSPSPVAHRQSMLSSPSRKEGSPYHASGGLSPSRLASNDPPRERPVFRNPSSVRAMQMSSPPPFSTPSPRSARHRRQQSEAARSRRGTPSHHPNPNKEYPLVLLHCTLTPLPSTFHFSPSVLEAVLPEEKLRDIALLKEKLGLGTTVLERGVLIPHPQEDYELLEERILESLELRKPRVGACGHFLPDDNAAFHAHNQDDCENECDAMCADCNRHVHPSLLEDGEFSRRWDVRIYAANGLMRAGAWSAAWREMEKIDVEVGVWFSDTMRRKLEEKAREEMQGGMSTYVAAPEPLRPSQDLPSMIFPDSFATSAQLEDTRSMHSVPASTATTSVRPGSATPTQRYREPTLDAQVPSMRPANEKLPLAVLLQNYLLHLFAQKKDILLAALIIVMGLILARGSMLQSPATTADLQTASSAAGPSPIAETTPTVAPPLVLATTTTVTEVASAPDLAMSTVFVTATVTSTATETIRVSASATALAFPACTFAAGDAGAEGLTALPSALAASVLRSEAAATGAASPPRETLEEELAAREETNEVAETAAAAEEL